MYADSARIFAIPSIKSLQVRDCDISETLIGASLGGHSRRCQRALSNTEGVRS